VEGSNATVVRVARRNHINGHGNRVRVLGNVPECVA
jgi:hypothetical protein